ncbi:hypothetical protein Tco_0370388 [Tanacetum coccineum]
MREADVILGIRIKHESNGIAISQSHYIEKVLKKFNYFDCTIVSTPMDTSEKLMPTNSQIVSQLEYSRVIDCLMYAMTCTWPDIAFVVGKLSRYTSNPGTQHWQAIQRVLKYLKKIIDYRLTYTGYPSVLEGYTDARWISNTEDNSSTNGWVFLLGGGAISWASKKQTCITGSTMESEFVALADAGKKDECAATLAKAYSQMYNEKSRHLGVRHSMIRELITNGVISIEFVRSQQNLVDHLTKGIARDLVIKSAEGMGLKLLIVFTLIWDLLQPTHTGAGLIIFEIQEDGKALDPRTTEDGYLLFMDELRGRLVTSIGGHVAKKLSTLVVCGCSKLNDILDGRMGLDIGHIPSNHLVKLWILPKNDLKWTCGVFELEKFSTGIEVTDIQKMDKKESQTDKTEHGNGKSVRK